MQEYCTRHMYITRVTANIFRMIANICRDANGRMDALHQKEELLQKFGVSKTCAHVTLASLPGQ